MLSTRFASLLLVGATALVGAACTSSSQPDPEPKAGHRLLTDADRDGYFSSEECDDPRPVIECGGPSSDDHQEPGDDGDTMSTNTGCTVVPGPTECAAIDVWASGTSSGSPGEDGPGDDANTPDPTTPPDQECYQCLDENGNPVGDPVCNTPSPISCEPYDPGPTGQNSTCWTCTDGDVTYTECYNPPTSCETDADCAAGETCVKPDVMCAPGENCPEADFQAFCTGSTTGGGGDDGGGEPPTPTPTPVGL